MMKCHTANCAPNTRLAKGWQCSTVGWGGCVSCFGLGQGLGGLGWVGVGWARRWVGQVDGWVGKMGRWRHGWIRRAITSVLLIYWISIGPYHISYTDKFRRLLFMISLWEVLKIGGCALAVHAPLVHAEHMGFQYRKLIWSIKSWLVYCCVLYWMITVQFNSDKQVSCLLTQVGHTSHAMDHTIHHTSQIVCMPNTHKTPRIGDHSVAALQCIKRFLGKAGYCKLGLVVWAAWGILQGIMSLANTCGCYSVLMFCTITSPWNCLSYKFFWGPFIHGQVRTTWIIATMGSWGGLTPSGATNLYVMMSNLSSVCACNCMIWLHVNSMWCADMVCDSMMRVFHDVTYFHSPSMLYCILTGILFTVLYTVYT